MTDPFDEAKRHDDLFRTPKWHEELYERAKLFEDLYKTPKWLEDINRPPKWFEDIYRPPTWLEDILRPPKRLDDIHRSPTLAEQARDLASVIPSALKTIELRESVSAMHLRDVIREQSQFFASPSPILEALKRQAYFASEMTRSLRRIEETYTAPLSSFIPLALPSTSGPRYEELFRDMASNALGSWRHIFDQPTVDRLAASLAEQAQEDPDTRLVDAVTEAVTSALKERDTRTDWRFVVSIIISLLLFLCADFRSTDTAQEVAAPVKEMTDTLKSVQRRLLLQDRLVRLILTREVERNARLFARPTSKSRFIGVVEAGSQVIVIERRNKWALVALADSDRSDSSLPTTGWMLNKYLVPRGR